MHRIWIIVLNAAILQIGIGCNSERDSEWFEMPKPEVFGEHRDPGPVAFTFGADATWSDLDCAIGPRVEEYQTVYGSRVRVEGTLHVFYRCGRPEGVVGLSGEAPDSFHFGIYWPDVPLDLDGQHVAMEGRLVRTYYSPEMRELSRRRYKRRPQFRWPIGFHYRLIETSFEAIEPSADPRSYEITPL